MQVWNEFLLKLDEKLGISTVNQWVRSIKVGKFDARNLYLETTDPLQVAWFEEHVRPHLKKGLLNNNGGSVQVHLFVAGKTPKTAPEAPKYAINPDRLDEELTFESFLTTEKNLVAYKLLSEKFHFNPIYIYGPKHTGKTHLLTAAALHAKEQGKKVFYVRAETFTSHVVQAIRLGLMIQFRKIYRDIDILIVDDVDFFAKKNATQEEFFHTFNSLQTVGKQIILSSRLPPSQLKEIEPRLMSRFEWGISMGIEAASPLEVLQKKAHLWKLFYSPEVISFLAENFPKDPLVALQALSIRTKGMSSISPEKAKLLLKDLQSQEEICALSPEKIAEETASHFGMKPSDLLGKSQTKECAYPRQIIMFLCREKLKLPFQKIGEIFKRDHSTVMSGIKQIQKRIEEKEESIQRDLKAIEKTLQ